MLAGDVTFGSGSRIIITSRDMQLVRGMERLTKGSSHDVQMYEVEKLGNDEVRQLFSLIAPTSTYSELDSTNFLTRMEDYAGGNPLALKLWSSLSHECSRDQMTEFLNEEMGSIYRRSYKVLRKNEKEIFLDIACFHKGKQIKDVREHSDCRSLSVDSGIGVLIAMSLIEIRDNYLWMHDVIQDMAREIVREICPVEPGNRTRLYTYKDILHVLQNNSGTATIQTMSLKHHFYQNTQINLTPQVFGKMHNLTFLKLDWYNSVRIFSTSVLQFPDGLESLPNVLRYLSWRCYPFGTLPSKFSPSCLVELHMPYSKLQKVWNADQYPQHLKQIDLSYSWELVDVPHLSDCLESINLQGCKSLVQVPNLSKSAGIVSINLKGCNKLTEVPSYFEDLHKLTLLNLDECSRLRSLPKLPSDLEYLYLGGDGSTIENETDMKLSEIPSSIWSLGKLVELRLQGCPSIESLSHSTWRLNSLTSLDLSRMSIEGLPSSVECLSSVISIKLINCKKLVSLSTAICKLKSLAELDLSGCIAFKSFPKIFEPMECLETLRLSKTQIKELDESIENLAGLKELELIECESLKSVPNSIYKLRFLEKFSVESCHELKEFPPASVFLWSLLSELNLDGCSSLEEIPDGLMICLISLEKLNLSKTKIKSIPTSIKGLSKLTSLYISGCVNLESLLELPYCLEILDVDGCTNLEMVSFSMTAVTDGLDRKRIAASSVDSMTEEFSFCSCIKLDKKARSNISDNAQLRIMRLAIVREQVKPEYQKRYDDIVTVYSGHEIPEWFRDKTEGSSINIKFPMNPANINLWEISICAVVTLEEEEEEDEDEDESMCTLNLIINNGDGSEFPFTKFFTSCIDESQVFVWYSSQWSVDVCNASEASFSFLPHRSSSGCRLKVERCGVYLFSPRGQEVVKFGAVDQDLGEPKPKPEQIISTKRSRDQYEASGNPTVALLDLFP